MSKVISRRSSLCSALHVCTRADAQQLSEASQTQTLAPQEPLQVPAWVQQVQQLSKWDVLLLLGV
jgi:hypothetical protein